MFGINEIPTLTLNKGLVNDLAKMTVNNRIAITGVQPKLSVDLENVTGTEKRLTIVGLWGNYILKPQNIHYPQMPEVEDLTMHLAELFKLKTCKHCLLKASDGQLVYIAKRFDRNKRQKIHMEDFCQIGEFQTEQKYNSSYERCGKLITKYCTNSGLDLVNYFELIIFSFLSGNNDMHMKNFSVLHQQDEIVLSPAYDLINSNLINPKDKEDVALSLNGKKKELGREDFDMLASVLKISDKIVKRIIDKFSENTDKVFKLIDMSFMTNEYKTRYKSIWTEKLNRLK
ncbi:HipA domain-containing protein [Pedobacter sp.]|jgi:serine/threonine-protein kinase HipA|uniref:HipA domain-containing protein n=1 Tax=Pedobacter sp. TaxID=1411316 RepID=UPI002B81E33A|nr:HipA domain-containing protein [Pedobacter sp.]HWW42970.1 HipA domain-containing protein [Pedobacter sp.]